MNGKTYKTKEELERALSRMENIMAGFITEIQNIKSVIENSEIKINS
jgi:hypothetical protein